MLIAPNPRELERRLRGRGTETDGIIEKRLQRAVREISLAPEYDYVVTNETDKSAECAEKLRNIIIAEHFKYARMKGIVEQYCSCK